MRKRRTILIFSLIAAICSTVALLADVETTGNLSMALNGDTIVSFITVIGLFVVYRNVLLKENNFCVSAAIRAKIGNAVTALLFSVCMIIGKSQNAHVDLKYPFLAVIMFPGYLWFFYFLLSFCTQWLTRAVRRERDEASGRITKWIFDEHIMISVFIFVFLCRLPYLIAFFPCSMSWDGGAQISNFYGIEIFTNHHPPLCSFFYGAIAWYSQKWGCANLGMFMIPLIQTALSAWAVSQLCILLHKLKSPYWMRWGTLLYFALFTVWSIFDVTVIKDSMYWQFTLLFGVEAAKCLYFKDEFFAKKRNMIGMIIYAILMMQIRNNGVFVLLFMAPFIILMSPKGKKWCTTAIVIVALGISTLLNQVVYPAAGVISLEDKVDTYCIMFQQTAKYVQEHSGDVTPEEREVLDKLFDYEELRKAYEPHLADWVKNCLRKQEGSTDDPTGSYFAGLKKDYFRVWFQQFMKHPFTYVEAFFECSYGYYYPDEGTYKEGLGFYEEERYMFTRSMSDASQIEGLARARFLLEQVSKLEYVPGIGMLYRCGFYAWCVIFAFIYAVVWRKYKMAVMTIPAVTNLLVCMISPVNTCIRYAMPTMCMIPLLVALLWYNENRESGDERLY